MRSAVDCRETDRGDVREEIVLGNSCGGGKRAAMEVSRCCWVTSRVWSHHYSLSLPTRQHQQLNNRDPDPSNTCHTELQSRTPPRVLLEVTDAPIYRAGPQLEAPLYVPDAPNNREGPQAREPSNCLSRLRYRKRLGKEVFWSPATSGSKKKKKRLW